MRRLIAVTSLLLLAFCAGTRPAAVVRVPAEIVNNRVHIPVSVNGQPPGPFILDTGAGGTPLAKEYADAIGIRGGAGTAQMIGAGGAVRASVAENVVFRFGGVDHHAERVPLIPLDPVNMRIGQRVNGVLGRNVLGRYVVEIDYAGREVAFHSPATWRPPADAVTVPIESRNGLLHLKARITLEDGRTLDAKLIVDTGAGRAVVLKKHFTDRHRIDTSGLIETSAGMGVGGATRDRVGRIARIELGGITISNPVTAFSLATAGALADPASDGLLGGEILQRFRLFVDYRGNRLVLVPTPAVSNPFEFDMSGALLTVRDAAFDALDIFTVLPGSPAAEAGLLAGDELRAIDGRAVSVAQLQEIRDGFRVAGKTYTITVRRGGAEQNVTLTTRRLV